MLIVFISTQFWPWHRNNFFIEKIFNEFVFFAKGAFTCALNLHQYVSDRAVSSKLYFILQKYGNRRGRYLIWWQINICSRFADWPLY